MVLGRMVQGGCRKRMPEAGMGSPLGQDVGPTPWGSGPTASSCISIPHHFLLLPPPSLFSFRVPPKPGTAGPPLQPNPFILLSLEHFGLLPWLRRKNLPAMQETWV